jgi:glycosyltransferase involved in cell wall biosynthesis
MYPLAGALRSLGIDCQIIGPFDWGKLAKGKIANILSSLISNSPKSCADVLRDPPDAVLISKASTPQIALLQQILNKKKTRLLFDLTDAIFLPTANLLGFHLRDSYLHELMIKKSDFVTANGHYLLKYVQALNCNSTIIHDPIDTKLFTPSLKNHKNKITIGWEGVPRHHYSSLILLKESLKRLSEEYDIRFKMVSSLGDPQVKKIFSKLENSLEIDYGPKEWLPLASLSKEMAEFDVMVAPLQSTLWYEGKSALRAGLGMALGIPVVASSVGEQKYVIKHNINGMLANNSGDWYKSLRALIDDDGLRKEIGFRGRMTVEEELSLSVCAKKLKRCILNCS